MMTYSKADQALIARITIMATSNLRLLAMPAEALLMWQRMMMLIVQYGTSGVLSLTGASGVGFSTLATIGLRTSETQLETWLETWAQNLSITWDRQAQTIGFPPELLGIATGSRRAAASRENGKKGGRPPKNPTFTPQNDPRQRSAMMPIAGGKTMTDENPAHSRVSRAREKLGLASSNSFEEKAKLEAPVSDAQIDTAYRRIGPKAFEAAGFDPARSMVNHGVVRQWSADALRAGFTADEAERLILGVVTSVTERQAGKGGAIGHLGYFSKAVAEAIARRDLPEAPLSEAEIEADRAFRRDLERWKETGLAAGEPVPNRAAYLARARAAA